MGYTINLIQRTSDGAIWNGSGFREISSQINYANAQFIVGDPENIPDNFGGLPTGEYRVMTFLTSGNPNFNFPMVEGVAFSNFNFNNTAANAVNVIFTGEGNTVILDPSSIFIEARQNRSSQFLLFTQQQIDDNALVGANPLSSNSFFNSYPEYTGLFYMDLEVADDTFYVGGYSNNGSTGTISALYLIVPR
jgi:hypothetical protein